MKRDRGTIISRIAICLGCVLLSKTIFSQKVNVFLGSSGDHGQMSPAACAPFGMLSIGPQTYPHGHTGYEYKAKIFLGFTHTRFEGVGCEGSGGNILITPVAKDLSSLIKKTEKGYPGFYSVSFTNGIAAAFAVDGKTGIERYHFPSSSCGFIIDLSHTLANPFVDESHMISGNRVTGIIRSGTTCGAGVYTLYYALQFNHRVIITDSAAHLVMVHGAGSDVEIRVALSSVDTSHAVADLPSCSFESQLTTGGAAWKKALGSVSVYGNPLESPLFYSLLYRTMQSPFIISEPDHLYRATDGTLQKTNQTIYHGWSVWDNYKTQLPLLSLTDADDYQNIITSLAGLYAHGKNNWAGMHEPSNSVRTEHSIVVLLDAYRKGYAIDFNAILDSLIKEVNALSYNHPDKALESCYDAWALSEILHIVHRDSLSEIYRAKAATWKKYWNRDFKDISKPDVDDLPARNMYQGTIWQYRWMVPYDMQGLEDACGGDSNFIRQLDTFFSNDYYNAANEPDIQVPYMYSGTSKPWRSQDIIHHYAVDTVVQYYYNDNSRGVDPFIGRLYNNRPDAYVRTMDDDGGAMSGWYVLAAIGLSPACVGWPVWYIHVPLFPKVVIRLPLGKHFAVTVSGKGRYVRSVRLNGKMLDRNWIMQEEIMKGGVLEIVAGGQPEKRFAMKDRWITDMSKRNN